MYVDIGTLRIYYWFVPAIGSICRLYLFKWSHKSDVIDITIVIIMVSVGLLVMRLALDKPENLKRR